MIKQELVIAKINFENSTELFSFAASLLQQKGIVKPGFLEALIQRENLYPTGLVINGTGIALPHTDRELVVQKALAVAICPQPVIFKKMDDPGQDILVKIVFFPLASFGQAKFLASLLNKIRNSDILNKLCNAKDKKEIWQLLKKSLNT